MNNPIVSWVLPGVIGILLVVVTIGMTIGLGMGLGYNDNTPAQMNVAMPLDTPRPVLANVIVLAAAPTQRVAPTQLVSTNTPRVPTQVPTKVPVMDVPVVEKAASETPEVQVTPEPTVTDRESLIEEALYRASLNYLANTPEDADAVARRIGFIGGHSESASLACGPLSIAIMKDAGLLTPSTSVHDIWLLCPRGREDCGGMDKLEKEYFPHAEYDYKMVTESVGIYDFLSDPLEPGDWMYLYASCCGFDHMLVVTRIDKDGVAYTVTNLNRGSGFNIVETKLYDPNHPGEGLFYELTKPKRGMLGMSGNGGFLRIRRIGGLSAVPTNIQLGSVLVAGAKWNGLVKEIGSQSVLFESLQNQPFHPASMIKVPIAMVVMYTLENRGLGVPDLTTESYGGRTLEQLLKAMLVSSEEDAANDLLGYLRRYCKETDVLKKWGASKTFFAPRQGTALDFALLLEGLYTGKFLTRESGKYLLTLMSTYTVNDSHYMGVLSSLVKGGIYYNKRGTLLDPTIVGDMGIFVFNGKAYIIVLCGSTISDGSATYEQIQKSIESFAGLLSKIIITQS